MQAENIELVRRAGIQDKGYCRVHVCLRDNGAECRTCATLHSARTSLQVRQHGDTCVCKGLVRIATPSWYTVIAPLKVSAERQNDVE